MFFYRFFKLLLVFDEMMVFFNMEKYLNFCIWIVKYLKKNNIKVEMNIRFNLSLIYCKVNLGIKILIV